MMVYTMITIIMSMTLRLDAFEGDERNDWNID